MKAIIYLILIITWIIGVILAKGFWSSLFAFFIPFWAWFLVIEKAMILNGFLM